jgi:transposase
VRRTTVLIDLLVHHVAMAVLCERWGLRVSCLYEWQKAFLLHGLESVRSRHSGGRRPQFTPKQQQRLGELMEAGPLVVGCETACWTSVLIRVLIWREFGVLSNCQYVCTLLHNWGFSFHKARFVSDHLATAKRLAWLEQKWPTIVRAAKRRQGLILCEDEASFAQWGSCVPRGRAGAGSLQCRPAASAKAPKFLARLHIFPGVCARRALRAGCTRKVTKGSYRCSWSKRLRTCF